MRNQYTPRIDNSYCNNVPRPIQNNPIHCNNCGKPGHPAAQCYTPSGGLAGQAPWRQNQVQQNNAPQFLTNRPPIPTANQLPQQHHDPNPATDTPAHLTGQTKDIIMMATVPVPPIIPIQSLISSTSLLHNDSHIWLIDSAASSHISGNLPLFFDMITIVPVTIQTASGDSFTADQSGSIRIKIKSDPSLELPDLHITLTDVIYVPSLHANLLSIGRMTNANVNILFSRYHSLLTLNGQIIARGPKINNLFVYSALLMPKETPEVTYYSPGPADIVLWHHRLAHMGYSTLETMKRLRTTDGFIPDVHHGPIAQCTDWPYGKQTRAPFQKIESLPANIGDIVASDLCGPFETSVGGFKHFITWIDLATRMASVDFLKDKECKMVTGSFKKYMAWLLRQKKAVTEHHLERRVLHSSFHQRLFHI